MRSQVYVAPDHDVKAQAQTPRLHGAGKEHRTLAGHQARQVRIDGSRGDPPAGTGAGEAEGSACHHHLEDAIDVGYPG